MTVATAPADVLAVDRWPREQLLELQRERLRDLLRYVTVASPYYREMLGADAVDAPLAELPTLSKATLMEEFDRIVTDPRLRLADVERHDSEVLLLRDYHVFATAGSTGLHGRFVFSQAEFAAWVQAAVRMLARVGVTPTTRAAAIGAPGAVHVTRRLFAALRSGRGGSPTLTVTMPTEEIVAALNAYRPEALATYPSIGSVLANEQLEGRLRIAPRVVAVGSEVLTDDAAQRMTAAWGVRPTNVYAATEAPLIAAGAPDGEGLYVCDDLVVVEAVDGDGRAVSPGTPGRKVLLTNLVNRTQPLIRYELSDSIVMADGPDASGRPYARILRVDGRSDDILRLPGRSGGEVEVNPYRLRAPFTELPDVRQYQIVSDGAGLRALVVLRPGAPRDVLDHARALLAKSLVDAGAAALPVEVRPVSLIAREPGDAAKMKLVKQL